MQQKDNFCTLRGHEHQQDQIDKKVSSFKKNPPQLSINENVLHKSQSESITIILDVCLHELKQRRLSFEIQSFKPKSKK